MKYITLKYLKISWKFWNISRPFLKYFMKLLVFNIKWLKTFKNMIKVSHVSRRYIMLFTHNSKYLPLTGLLTLLQWTIHKAEKNIVKFLNYFRNISWNISGQKNSWNFTSLVINTKKTLGVCNTKCYTAGFLAEGLSCQPESLARWSAFFWRLHRPYSSVASGFSSSEELRLVARY